jgi:hypothetical protein
MSENNLSGEEREAIIDLFEGFGWSFDPYTTSEKERRVLTQSHGLWFLSKVKTALNIRHSISVYSVGSRLDIIHGRISGSAHFSIHLDDPDSFGELESKLDWLLNE